MKSPSEAGKLNDSQSEKNQELFQKYDILEKYWQSSQNQRRNSTGSSYGGSVLASFDLLRLLENSPRELMSSLQTKISPSHTISSARNGDVTFEEVIMDRRDAIMSGKLKRRRLVFDSIEVANEVALELDYEDNSGVMIQEREVIMNGSCEGKSMSQPRSCTLLGSILSEEGVVEEEEMTVVEVERVAEKSGCWRLRSGGGGRCMVLAMAWLVILLFVIIFGLISMRCNGKTVHGELVPT